MFFLMQNIFVVPAMQHGCRAKALFVTVKPCRAMSIIFEFCKALAVILEVVTELTFKF